MKDDPAANKKDTAEEGDKEHEEHKGPAKPRTHPQTNRTRLAQSRRRKTNHSELP